MNEWKKQLDALTRPQLIALVTQKHVFPFRLAVKETKRSLVALCMSRKDLLKGEKA